MPRTVLRLHLRRRGSAAGALRDNATVRVWLIAQGFKLRLFLISHMMLDVVIGQCLARQAVVLLSRPPV